MTADSLRALLAATAAATPGPWEWDGNVWDYDPEQEAPWLISPTPLRPIIQGEVNCSFANATYIAAASPDVVASLAKIALAAAAVYATRGTWYESKGKAAHDAEATLQDALDDAGLLTTAPQETQP